MTESLTIGERVAWYRRRRGMSQEVLAGLIGRSADWLQRAENNRIQLDRLSVIHPLWICSPGRSATSSTPTSIHGSATSPLRHPGCCETR
jgi:hypothetical protein